MLNFAIKRKKTVGLQYFHQSLWLSCFKRPNVFACFYRLIMYIVCKRIASWLSIVARARVRYRSSREYSTAPGARFRYTSCHFKCDVEYSCCEYNWDLGRFAKSPDRWLNNCSRQFDTFFVLTFQFCIDLLQRVYCLFLQVDLFL